MVRDGVDDEELHLPVIGKYRKHIWMGSEEAGKRIEQLKEGVQRGQSPHEYVVEGSVRVLRLLEELALSQGAVCVLRVDITTR